MKVLVTGASGFVGRHVVRHLVARGHEAHAPTRRPSPTKADGLHWFHADLLRGKGRANIRAIQPDALIHLAWDVTPGKYLLSPANTQWVEATDRLVDAFVAAGGDRLVLGGTCFEYAPSYDLLHEERTPSHPGTPYAAAKLLAWRNAEVKARENGISAAEARIFYPYGPGEPKEKFLTSLLTRLAKDEDFVVTNPGAVRDYIHVDDVAQGLVALAEKPSSGVVNLCTGHGVSMLDLARLTAHILGRREDRLKFNIVAQNEDRIVGDASKAARNLGWVSRIRIQDGVRQLVQQHQQAELVTA